jgi:hypothetical protein
MAEPKADCTAGPTGCPVDEKVIRGNTEGILTHEEEGSLADEGLLVLVEL